MDLGLARLEAALAAGGHPEQRFTAVQVAGTNGKGSICTLLAGMLNAAGLRVGIYRSPHLVSWCERIQIGDDWISPEDLRRDLQRWQPLGRQHRLTPFELLTAAAFDRFAASELDLVVLEVGLGGRLDATTAHPQRRVIGFASIGLDHREHLGDTIAAIAAEKAAVLRPGCLAVSGPQSPEAAAVLEAEAARCGVQLHWVEPLAPAAAGGPRLGLSGDHQRHNAAVALGMVEALRRQGWTIPDPAVEQGLQAARWPGRLEQRHWRGRPLLLDGAHNPPAALALRRELLHGDGPAPRRWLLGIQRHKQAPAMLEALLIPGDQALITTIEGHRCWSRDDLIEACPQLASQLETAADAAGALDWLTTTAAPSQPLPVIAGSLHLLGALIPALDP
ncbi:MAG: bifunctional folylpolyglutamate synthase/dihydrofolate synthase [Synechococcaceae cyanobacterium]|nr:bifunctional folylpolyglutamate synthase/dihydrofolate synthase [Synechococcaceae cyanobacterium]